MDMMGSMRHKFGNIYLSSGLYCYAELNLKPKSSQYRSILHYFFSGFSMNEGGMAVWKDDRDAAAGTILIHFATLLVGEETHWSVKEP
jgi:hypothetical protein